MSKTREQIITSMCYTWRHDYGLDRQEHDGPGGLITAGLTEQQRKTLWQQMAQIFDNDIAPNMTIKQPVQYAHDSARTDWIEP
jgi:hypothetical protein